MVPTACQGSFQGQYTATCFKDTPMVRLRCAHGVLSVRPFGALVGAHVVFKPALGPRSGQALECAFGLSHGVPMCA